MMQLSAAAAGAAALTPVLDWSAYAKQEGPKGPTAIIGGGVAGLTAAYRLHEAGGTPRVFEASNRWGGRMLTKPDFYEGMFCELGGELVDTGHKDLRNLCAEFGIEMQKLDVEGGEDLYFFNGCFRTLKDIIDPQAHCGAFAPIVQQIGDDADKLYTDDDKWTAHARWLDKTKSLKAYLENLRKTTKVEDWVIEMLDVAYVGEYGMKTEVQSSLNLVNFIGTDLSKPFQIFGESDEAWRIKGGSSKLIEALEAALKNDGIEMKLGYELKELHVKNSQIVMTFDAPGGAQHLNFDTAILALPFTRLRDVKGVQNLVSENKWKDKWKCINELGMGQNAKIMFGTKSRVWRNQPPKLPVRSNGSICSDLKFQDFWETSRNQPGEAGILSVFLGGNTDLTFDEFRAELAQMSPKMAESLDPAALISFPWNSYRYTLGSYSGAQKGQYTTMLQLAREPALSGRLQFAGEHTEGPDNNGYMNGGVVSGNRAAKALADLMALEPPVIRECPHKQAG
jgi:monoamine oxidase